MPTLETCLNDSANSGYCQESAESALGNTRKISVPPPTVVYPEMEDRAAWKRQIARLKGGANELLSEFRLWSCCRWMLPRQVNPGRVVLLFQTSDNHVVFRGLCRCGSLWGCPRCASIITEYRRRELRLGIDRAIEIGWHVFLLTLTFPHTSRDHPKDLQNKFRKALGIFYNRKTWRKWRVAVGYEGKVAALEIRLGDNGWHIHQHVLVFIDPSKSKKPILADDLKKAYRTACVKAGLNPPNDRGVDIRGGAKAADYVAKYGLESELAKSHTKRGKNGSRSPWDILGDYCDGNRLDTAERDGPKGEKIAEDARLFREYYEAFKGQKQLVWSRGLRDLLGLGEEETDLKIVEEQQKAETFLGSLNEEEWGKVLHFQLVEDLIDTCERDGLEGFKAFKLKIHAIKARGS